MTDRLWPRAILHVDMDAFFASVEQKDHPELRGKPVIVGGAAERRGVVSAASYEARTFGVHSAMPTAQAKRLCPHGIFLPVRMARYQEVSQKIFEILSTFTPDLEQVSIDEAFLDVTGCQRLFGPPLTIARLIKEAIRKETDLTCSIGVAPTLFVAKIASDLEKPDGLVVIPDEEVLARLRPLPVEKLWGVGEITARRLHRLGITTLGDLQSWPRATLIEHLGELGSHLHDLAHGIDPRIVEESDPEKSLSHEETFAEDVLDLNVLEETLLELSDKVARRARARGSCGRTIVLKVRYHDFTTITRRRTLPRPIHLGILLYHEARRLLHERTEAGVRPIRLIGVGLTGLVRIDREQPSLFDLPSSSLSRNRESHAIVADEGGLTTEKIAKVEEAVDQIRRRLGDSAVIRGRLLHPPDPKRKG